MKIRYGFVSNSSSSSFAIVITKDAYSETIKNVHPYIRYIVRQMNAYDKKFVGFDVILLSNTFFSEDFELYDDYEEEEALDYKGNVVKVIKDDDGNIENASDYMLEADAVRRFISTAKELRPHGIISNESYG